MLSDNPSILFVTVGDIDSVATSKRAFGLANPLSSIGWTVYLLLQDSKGNRNRAHLECNSSVHLLYYKRSSVLMEVVEKNRIIETVKPNYIYDCAYVSRNFLFRHKGCRVVIEHSELQSSIRRGIAKNQSKILEYLSTRLSDGLILASKYLFDYYQSRTKVPLLYSPYAYSPDLYTTNVEDSDLNDFRCRFGVAEDDFVFVFLGSIAVNFGAFLMVESVRRLLLTRKKVKLLLLGNGKCFDDLKEFVEADCLLKDHVLLAGFVDEEEIKYFFSLASAFILPMNDTVQDKARCPSKLYMYLPYCKPIVTARIGEPFSVLGDKGYYYDCGSNAESDIIQNTAITGFGPKYIEESVLSMVKVMDELVVKNVDHVDYDVTAHAWQQRATELSTWLLEIR